MDKKVEMYRNLAERYIALSSKQQKLIEDELNKEVNYYIEHHNGMRATKGHRLIYLAQKYRGKILVRGFLLAYKFDWRRKNPLAEKIYFECYRAYEGIDRAVCRGISINYSTWDYTNKLQYYKCPEYTLYCKTYYDKYSGAWHSCEPDYFDKYADQMYSNDEIIELCPELKYSMLDVSKDNLIMFLEKYRIYPEIEILRKLKYPRCERSKRILAKLQSKDSKRFKKLLFLLKDEPGKDDPAFLISYFRKHGIDSTKYKEELYLKDIKDKIKSHNRYCYELQGHTIDIDKAPYLAKIFKKANADFGYYEDYLRMAKRVGHDVEDEYWKYPNDLKKAHDKVMKEQKALDKAKNKVKELKLQAVVKDMLKFNENVDGYDIFIPDNYDVIKKQCDVLYQCLLRCGYDEKMIKQDIILVFIQKDGKPIATAEVKYDKKVGQFYADEHNRGNCLPSKEVEDAFNKWLADFKPKKKKINHDVNYWINLANSQNSLQIQA